jgi:aryl-alcohol dehydrogenase-like predicted oxidoreductase
MSAATAAPKLETVYLGQSTGLKVSNLCLGAMTFAIKEGVTPGWGMPCISQEQSFAVLDKYAAWGGNFIDTADIYAVGESETVVGNWLVGKNREDFIIATKVCGPAGSGPNDVGLSRKHIMAAVEGSLKRLKTNYIDLYQVHSFDLGTPLKETLSALSDLVRAGKVRYIGCSNYTGYQTMKAINMSDKLGLEIYCTHQGQYSLLERGADFEILPVVIEEGLGFLPWSPLKGGWLSGRYKRGKAAAAEAGSRVEWAQKMGWKGTDFESHAKESTWAVLEEVEAIAKETGRTMAQVSLRWVMQRPGVTSTVIGARSLAQLEDNLGASTFTLSADQMARLN